MSGAAAGIATLGTVLSPDELLVISLSVFNQLRRSCRDSFETSALGTLGELLLSVDQAITVTAADFTRAREGNMTLNTRATVFIAESVDAGDGTLTITAPSIVAAGGVTLRARKTQLIFDTMIILGKLDTVRYESGRFDPSSTINYSFIGKQGNASFKPDGYSSGPLLRDSP